MSSESVDEPSIKIKSNSPISNENVEENIKKSTLKRKLKNENESSISVVDKKPRISKNVDNKCSNSSDTTNLVANYYNTLEEKGLLKRRESRIVYMRNFNNWIKSMFIDQYLRKIREGKSHGDPVRVLDMCCGKGGDLYKWKKGHISHLICADIAEVSVEQCQHRYNEMKKKFYNRLFTAEFLPYDCTRIRLREKYEDASMQLDLVSCQFAFHYGFESLSQAECMLKNASESLKSGGYFIGSIPNANELVARWQKIEGNKFGNNIYNIDFDCDKNNVPIFGAKYNFLLEGVVNCPEFLVYIPAFCKLASKYGLELVMLERFEDYYEKMKRDGKFLLTKMQALEAYPSTKETPLLGLDSNEYQHAVEYMKNSRNHNVIGTLSQSEWEAISLYLLFAFRKLKVTWNAEGKPEFIKD